uniref:Uncharacterized protein n=1 Tax=Paulinella longichromatophora TaxID=1708747 RepID=A0A2H4ZPB5_9EUKA|nr:hypothetical protein PLO_371 [Paulinella longichromatophora]
MSFDLNDQEIDFSDLVYAYQSWVLAVIHDFSFNGDKMLTDEIEEDALKSMRFLPGEVTSAIETTLGRAYRIEPDEISILLFPEEDD